MRWRDPLLVELPVARLRRPFGVEVGAVLWFAGAVTLGARAKATVLRAVALLLTALAGAALIVTALVRGWTGAGLGLAMEFGVGALAIPVIDVVLLGFLHSRLDQFAFAPDDRVVRLRLGRHLTDSSVEVDRRPDDTAPRP